MERYQFYKTQAWRNCQREYKNRVLWCERCLNRGLFVPGYIVHHKTYLSDDNFSDPSVALNFDNLELLCLDCHNKEHFRKDRRYRIDKDGNVIMDDEGRSGVEYADGIALRSVEEYRP